MTLLILPLWLWGIASGAPLEDSVSADPSDPSGTGFRVGERYTPSDEVLAVLGLPTEYIRADEIDFGVSLDARIATNIDCGKLKLDVDIQGDVTDIANEIPGQLVGASAALISAAPMLVLCHASPSLCSELKNLNLRIDGDLDFRYAACKSINNYIDKKAKEGDENFREMETNWLRECHQGKIDLGMDVQSASIACQRAARDPRPTAIAQGFVGQVFTEEPQRIVREALRAVGRTTSAHSDLEEFLLATIGDAEIGVNGEWTPVIAEGGSAGAEEVSHSLLYHGTTLACNVPRLRLLVPREAPDPNANQVTFVGDEDWTDHTKTLIEDLIKRRMVYSNTTDIQMMGWMARETYCHSLGEALALQAARDLQTEWDGIAARAQDNPELPTFGKMKLKGFQALLEDTVEALENKRDIPTVSKALLDIKAQADAMRAQSGAMADVTRAGEEFRQRILSRPCDSYTTCGGVP